jgi:Tfp pilus assembly protein PilX
MDNSNDIFEPNHLNSENIIQEDYYGNESDSSVASSSSSSSTISATSTTNNNAAISWVELQRFDDIALADAYVIASATRDSTKPVCIYYNKLEVSKHKMLQQTRLCRSDACKKSEVVCTFKYKYQKCETCKEATVWSAGEHPVEQVVGESRRGIDERVKAVIDDIITKSVREIRPIDIFIHLNLVKTKYTDMKGLIQPTLPQIQSYLKIYRITTLGVGVNTTAELKTKIKANMYHPNIPDEQGFYFGYEMDGEGEPIIDANNFRIGFTSKKLLSYFNINSFPIYHIDNTYSINKNRYPLLAFGRTDFKSFNKQIKFVYTGYELYTVCKFLDICFDKLINQFSCQPKEFCFYRPPTFDMIVKANRILEIEPNPFTSGGINVYYITSKSKAGYQYQLSVQDHQAYPGFKFVWCNCIGIVKT